SFDICTMMRSLLALTVLLLSPEFTQSAGKCNLSNPPKSWLTTKALGIMEWATAGISDQGEHFCVNRHPSGLVEANYHVNLGKGVNQESAQLTQSHRTLWDNPYNQCILDDDQIHVCFPYCAKDKQKIAIKAALSSGNPRIVARSIERLVNTEDWAITVMKVDFNDPDTHLNVTSFADPKVWCAIYIGIDPFVGSSYLYEIQLAKIIR
ncbi:hypothetical protein V3C99_007860, partial [Haemonchus contortus]